MVVTRCDFQMVWPGSGTDLGPMQLPPCQVYLRRGHGDGGDGVGLGDHYYSSWYQ